MNNIYIIYMHTAPNNKKYIGVTKNTTKQRWGKDGYNYRTQPKFYRAIQKYGWENFKHEVLVTNLSFEEAYKKEAELILFFMIVIIMDIIVVQVDQVVLVIVYLRNHVQ